MNIAPTFLGTIQNVEGATAGVELADPDLSGVIYIKGRGYRIGQLGSFVKIPIGYISLFGVISQVGAGAVPERLREEGPRGRRWITVQLIGESISPGKFDRGISQFPTIGDPVHVVVEQDLRTIYGKPESPNYVSIGHLAGAESIPALINVDKLITRHSAVVGTTGAGKSTTVASLLIALSDRELYPSARIMVLDIHGEYGRALKDKATIFKVNPDSSKGENALFIPYWALCFDDLLKIAFGTLEDKPASGILERVFLLKQKGLAENNFPGVSQETLTVDTPVPFSIQYLWYVLHRLLNATHLVPGAEQCESTEAVVLDPETQKPLLGDALNVIPPKYEAQSQAAGKPKIYLSSSQLNIRREVENFRTKLKDPRFDFLFKPGVWWPDENGKVESDLDSLLKSWIGDSKSITILDLSGIPVGILTDLIGALLKLIYDALFWSRDISEGGRERPLLLVLEEAHTYLGAVEDNSAAMSVKRIVKEGRKYGIGAMVISQRPSEIDPTVLSQCGTIFALRLSNSKDRSIVVSSAADNLESLFSVLPVLRTGEVLLVGEAVHLPIRAVIEPPPVERRPDSADPLVYNAQGPGGWNRFVIPSNYAEVVELWRRQSSKSPSLKSKTAKTGA